MADGTDAQFEIAEARGRKALETEPRAASAHFDPATKRIVIELENGCSYAFPVELVQDLHDADTEDLADIKVDGMGFNLHWPKLDVDLYVPALVAGIFGTREWMARELARIAGRKTSAAKAAASRANGARGRSSAKGREWLR